jgi:hypothetical protein
MKTVPLMLAILLITSSDTVLAQTATPATKGAIPPRTAPSGLPTTIVPPGNPGVPSVRATPANPQDLSGGSNLQDLTRPGASNSQDLRRR